MSTLCLDQVSVALGGKTVLEGITHSFAAGEVSVVIGPNGAGKSTLLSLLAGLRAPDRGVVRCDGKLLGELGRRQRARTIGYLPQSAELHWDLEVRELVALGRAARQGRFARLSPADDAAIDRALDVTGTRQFAGRGARSLSGGERARVLLARVLAGEPQWILADEPLASLDPAHQVAMLGVLRTAARSGAGVVLVLHDLALAHWIADRVLLLKDGRPIAGGGPEVLADGALVRSVYDIDVTFVERADGTRLLVPLPGTSGRPVAGQPAPPAGTRAGHPQG